jgi:hypothetical protein
VGYVEDLRGKKQGAGRPRWRARYRDPAGRERSKSFTRKVDAERFLVSIEDAKLRGAYVARPPVGCRSVSGPSGGSGRRQPCARARARTRPVGQASSQGPPDPVADPSERCGRRAASPQRARGHQAPQGPAQGDVLPDRRPGGRWASGVGGVKTHGARTVRLPRSLAEELDAYLAGRLNGREDLVFTAPRGGPLRESKFVPE